MITFENDHERALWSQVYAGIITHPFLRERRVPSADADVAVLHFRERNKSLAPVVGAEGGAGIPAVENAAEPGPVVGGSAPPARASIAPEALTTVQRKAQLAEALDPDGEGLFFDDPRGKA